MYILDIVTPTFLLKLVRLSSAYIYGILASSNASYKIRMYNAYTEGYQLPLNTCDLVHSWYDILDSLENTDTDTSILGDYLSLLSR